MGGWRRLETGRSWGPAGIWGLGRGLVRDGRGWGAGGGGGSLSRWGPQRFLSHSEKCQRGFSLPRSLPPSLVGSWGFDHLHSTERGGGTGRGLGGLAAGGKPAKVEVEKAGNTHSGAMGADGETDRDLRLEAAWRGEGEAGTSLCQVLTAGQEFGWGGAQFPWGN